MPFFHMTVNGQCVDLEVQVCNEGDYPERVMYYWAREFSSALPAGQDYSRIKWDSISLSFPSCRIM